MLTLGRWKKRLFPLPSSIELLAVSGFNIPVDWALIRKKMTRSEPAGAAERLSTSPFRIE
jgi:hypothetical protein